MILSEAWQVNEKTGRKNPGYDQSREHIRLIEKEGYRLMTFPMRYDEKKDGTAKIAGITPVLTEKKLISKGRAWYAVDIDDASPIRLAEELPDSEKHLEGGRVKITINGYERSPKARAACIAHYGYKCAVCGFDFSRAYGSLGERFIHVHHIVPFGKIRRQRPTDPIKDLRPVCPNCHAMIHRPDKITLTIRQLQNYLTKQYRTTLGSFFGFQ